MLKSLSIRNVILIDKLDLDFSGGFSVLSGETGAGKSILLDSLGLLLGQRAEVSMIRPKCDKLSVSGCFEYADKDGKLAAICAEHNLDFEREILIARSLSLDGRSKIFFNDQPITLKLLKEIGALLVEVHGQFDNQGLLNPATHLSVLDSYGKYDTALGELKQAFEFYKAAQKKRIAAEEELKSAQEDEENLRHWIREFSTIKPRDNELAELEQKRQFMMSAEKLIENFNAAYRALNNPSQSVRDCLRQAQSAIARINGMTADKYGEIYELLDTALVNAEEATDEIETALSAVNVSEEEINAAEERLFALKDLARKHHTTVEDLPNVWQNMESKLLHLERGADDLNALLRAEKQARENYILKADIVHQERVSAASRLDKAMQKELPALKMEKAAFMTQVLQKKEESAWNESGYDEVCFMVSTNVGTPYGSLNKIASGGELARFMLALKVNLGQAGMVETMIFDEVDTGIGGATAQAVGAKLAQLGDNKQVLVVTHSPQVAAFSNNHYKVEKFNANGETTTKVRLLSANEKQEEVARMLSGEVISDEARAAAKVLIGA
ncbi:MAG: DNA repair protein RecN [Alphaproteobacteria bacterium]|nr:DNA repair protein RecN [Alphaproteobacteria bacterium]